jgi:hypothetical protein
MATSIRKATIDLGILPPIALLMLVLKSAKGVAQNRRKQVKKL